MNYIPPFPHQVLRRQLRFQLTTMFMLTANAAVVFVPFAYFGTDGLVLALPLALTSLCLWLWSRLAAVTCGIACLATLLWLTALHSPLTPNRRSQCYNNMRNIALALANYASDHGCYPPAYIADDTGRPMHSWRVLILPYLEEGALYQRYRFDEPWDGPNNKKLHNSVVTAYECPDATGPVTNTGYLALVGQNTVLRPNVGRPLDEITDGVSKTMMIVEHQKAAVHWMDPTDIDFDACLRNGGKQPLPLSSSHFGRVSVVTFADAHTLAISPTMSAKTFAAAASVDGGEPLSEGDF